MSTLTDHGGLRFVDPEESSTEQLEEATTSAADAARILLSTAGNLDDRREAVESSREEKRERKAADERKEKRAKAGPIKYKKLFRAGDSLIGDYFTFEGKITQNAGEGIYMVAVTKETVYTTDIWSDLVILTLESPSDEKLLEDDIISFTARSAGTLRYETVIGSENEVPALIAEGGDVKVTGTD